LRAPAGPGVEFLQYLSPRDGRPAPPDTSPEDLWSEVIVMRVDSDRRGEILREPDGHTLLLQSH